MSGTLWAKVLCQERCCRQREGHLQSLEMRKCGLFLLESCAPSLGIPGHPSRAVWHRSPSPGSTSGLWAVNSRGQTLSLFPCSLVV